MNTIKNKWSFQLDGIRRHKLMTLKISNKMPNFYETEKEGIKAKIGVKFFCILNRYTFLATEFDGDDTLFGYCLSPQGPDFDEWGYCSLSELASQNLKGCPVIERDLYLEDQTVEEYLIKNISTY